MKNMKKFIILTTVIILLLFTPIALYRVLCWDIFSFHDVCYSNDGKFLISAPGFFHPRYTFLWDCENWKERKFPPSDFDHYFVTISPGDRFAAISQFGGDQNIALYDLSPKNISYIYGFHGTSPCFSSNGRYFMFIDAEWKNDEVSMVIWDIENKKVFSRIGIPNPNSAYLSPLPDSLGRNLVVSKSNRSKPFLFREEILDWQSILRKLKKQDTSSCRKIFEELDEESRKLISSWIPSKNVDEKTKRVLLRGINKIIERSNLHKYPEFQKLDFGEDKEYLKRWIKENISKKARYEFNRLVIGRVFSEEIAEFDSAIIRIWDIETSQCLKILFAGGVNEYSEVYTAKDKIILIISRNKAGVLIIDLKTNNRTKVELDDLIPYVLTVSNDGSLIAFLTDNFKSLKIWNLDKNMEVSKISVESFYTPIKCLKFSPDNKLLAVGSAFNNPRSGQLNIYDVQTGELKKSIKPKVESLRTWLHKILFRLIKYYI